MAFNANQQVVVDLFIAAYGRAPAQGGLDFFKAKLDSGEMTSNDIADYMVDTANNPEAATRFPDSGTTADKVNSVFQNVLGRTTATAEGLAYWVDKVDNEAGYTISDLIHDVINSAKAHVTDAETLANKSEVVEYFLDNVSVDDQIGAQVSTDSVITDANVVTAKAAIDTSIDDASFSIELGAQTAIADADGSSALLTDEATVGSISSLDGKTLTVSIDNSAQLATFSEENNSTNAVETYTETLKIAAANEVTGTNYIKNSDGTVIGTATVVDLQTTGTVSTYTSQNLHADGTTVVAAATTDENLFFTITFNSQATTADLKAILEGVTVSTNGGDAATDVELRGEKVITATIKDATGATIASDTQTIKNGDDDRQLAGIDGDSVDFDISTATAIKIEQGTNVDSDAVDAAALQFEKTVLTVSLGATATGTETLALDGTNFTTQESSGSTLVIKKADGTAIGTMTGGTSGSDLVITLNTEGTAVNEATIEALAENITFLSTDTGEREVTFTLSDNGAVVGVAQKATVIAFGQATTILAIGAANAPADDTYTGTADSDLFAAANNIIADGHTINGAAGSDLLTLVLNGDALTGDSAGSDFVVTDVENISITTATVGSSIDMTKVTATAGIDIDVEGDQALTLTNIGANVKSIDASASTGGIQTYTFTGTSDVTVKTAAQNDILNMVGTLTDSDTIDGGAGTDTLSTTLSAGTYTPAIKNVETMNLTLSDDADVILNLTAQDAAWTSLALATASTAAASLNLTVTGTDLTDDTNIAIDTDTNSFVGDLTVNFGKTLDVNDSIDAEAAATTVVNATITADYIVGATMADVDTMNLKVEDATTADALTLGLGNADAKAALVFTGGHGNTHTVALGAVTSDSVNTSALTSNTTASFAYADGTDRTVAYAGNGLDVLNVTVAGAPAIAGKHILNASNVDTLNITGAAAATLDVDGVTSGTIVTDNAVISLANVNTNVNNTANTNITTIAIDSTATGLNIQMADDNVAHVITGGAGSNTYTFATGIGADVSVTGKTGVTDTLNVTLEDGDVWTADIDIEDVEAINVTMTDDDTADTVLFDLTNVTSTNATANIDMTLINADVLDTVTITNIQAGIKSINVSAVSGGTDITLVKDAQLDDTAIILSSSVVDTINFGAIAVADSDWGSIKLTGFVGNDTVLADRIDFSTIQDLTIDDLTIVQTGSDTIISATDFTNATGGAGDHTFEITLIGQEMATLDNDSLIFA